MGSEETYIGRHDCGFFDCESLSGRVWNLRRFGFVAVWICIRDYVVVCLFEEKKFIAHFGSQSTRNQNLN